MPALCELPPPVPALVWEMPVVRSGTGPQPQGPTGLALEEVVKNAIAHWQATFQSANIAAQRAEESSSDYVPPPPVAEYSVRVRVTSVQAGTPLPFDLPNPE